MEKQLVPKLRFSEFKGNWNKLPIEMISSLLKDGSHGTHKDFPDSEFYLLSAKNIKNGTINFDESDRKISKVDYDLIFKNYSLKKDDILLTIVGTIGRLAKFKNEKNIAFQRSVAFFRFENNVPDFIFHYMNSINFQKELLKRQVVSAQPGIYLGDLAKIPICLTTIAEQQKIASFLTSVDERITLLNQQKEKLELYKKGIMQQLFSQEIRFKDEDGNDFPEWEEKKLGELLDYEQPTKYIVNDTGYNDSFDIPVLTAGKTFILGYTNETENIFHNNLPVIIFDDFTTANKFVNFPFKVKSSAMKILHAKENVNIKYVYEAIQMIKFEVGGHGRHWISKYSNIYIDFPSEKEQQKIATFLTAIDERVEQIGKQIDTTIGFKKGLLQQLFV